VLQAKTKDLKNKSLQSSTRAVQRLLQSEELAKTTLLKVGEQTGTLNPPPLMLQS
jgi:hypothetical protein